MKKVYLIITLVLASILSMAQSTDDGTKIGLTAQIVQKNDAVFPLVDGYDVKGSPKFATTLVELQAIPIVFLDTGNAGYVSSTETKYIWDGGSWSEDISLPPITDNQLVIGTGSSIEGDSYLTWDGDKLLLSNATDDGKFGINTSSPTNMFEINTDFAITTPVFTGSGLDDISVTGTFAGYLASVTYIVRILTDSTYFTFTDGKYSTYIDTIPITGSEQNLTYGIKILFESISGHTTGDSWTFTASNGTTPMAIKNSGNTSIFSVNNNGGITVSDGLLNYGEYNAFKIRNQNFLKIFGGSSSTGYSFALGGFNLPVQYTQSYGNDTWGYYMENAIVGHGNALFVDKLNYTYMLGVNNWKGTSGNKISSPGGDNIIIGAQNMNIYTADLISGESVEYDQIYTFGRYNGGTLPPGSSKIYLYGDYLYNESDLPYIDRTKPLNRIMGFGFGGTGDPLKAPGTMWLYAMFDSTSYFNINVDEFRINGNTFGGGAWSQTDTTTYVDGRGVVVFGTVPDSTEKLTVYGDIWLDGTINGPYINHTGVDNIFFGETIEVTDSTAMIVKLVAGENITIGDLLYTDTDFKLFIADNTVDSSARVQYIAYETVSADADILVVKTASFVSNDAWTWVPGILYLDAAGAITQTPTITSTEWVTEIGWAVSATSIYFYPTIALKLD